MSTAGEKRSAKAARLDDPDAAGASAAAVDAGDLAATTPIGEGSTDAAAAAAGGPGQPPAKKRKKLVSTVAPLQSPTVQHRINAASTVPS